MQTVQFEIPVEPLLYFKETLQEFAKELKPFAAFELCVSGRLSSGRSAQLAALSRVAFLMKPNDYKASPVYSKREESRPNIARI